MTSMPEGVLDRQGLQVLLDVLRASGWSVIGPVVRDGVITHAEVSSLDELPRGVRDVQDCASYRLDEHGGESLLGYAVGPESWKSILFPSRQLLRGARTRAGESLDQAAPPDSTTSPIALFGVRSCDLHAIAKLDDVLLGRQAIDAHYAARRASVLVIAVSCSDPGGTCFCASMGTGPEPQEDFDLALTELLDVEGHRFLIRSGSSRGAELMDRLPLTEVADRDRAAAGAVVDSATARMGRRLDTDDLRDLLYANAQHPQWTSVADRCLACSNCTLVCPTCFCTSVEDSTDLLDGSAERARVWDSCFTSEHSHLAGGSVRGTTAARYRQWTTHKLASWWDQFGSSGCVGCGRCVTWCPAAIDITAEVAAIRATSGALTSNDHREL
jgi:sulfhydrogenase subunit beta (sulfur reductase)